MPLVHRKTNRQSPLIRIRIACWISALFLAVIGLMTMGANAFAEAPDAEAPDEYRVGSGDNLRVTVFGEQDLSGEFLVDGAGFFSLPLIGEVRAGGLIVREVERVIVKKLKPDYLKNPSVSVAVLNYRPFYIIGEVQKPGSYAYVSGMKVVNAIALAGGYTYRARENNVLITRARNPERKKQRANHDTVVLPGDVIEVPERFF